MIYIHCAVGAVLPPFHMGNSYEKQSRCAIMPQNPMLSKGYTCYFYRLSTFAPSMEKIKCTVVDFSNNHKLYHLRADVGHKEYNHIPYFYVSPGSQPYTWEDYFKIGTVVRHRGTGDGRPLQAVIIDIRQDVEYDAVVDIKNIKTGFVTYGVRPSMYYLDVPYYKDW